MCEWSDWGCWMSVGFGDVGCVVGSALYLCSELEVGEGLGEELDVIVVGGGKEEEQRDTIADTYPFSALELCIVG